MNIGMGLKIFNSWMGSQPGHRTWSLRVTVSELNACPALRRCGDSIVGNFSFEIVFRSMRLTEEPGSTKLWILALLITMGTQIRGEVR
jgi:hypothetical protein